MNSAHWHLLLNHVPVLGVWFSGAFLVAAVVLRSLSMVRSSWVALILCAAVAVPVYLTGEPTEDIVETRPEVSKAILEQHEDAAKIALIAIESLGGLALVSLVVSWRRDALVRPLSMAALALALVCGLTLAYTANLGGQIRHSEIRNDVLGAAMSAGSESKSKDAVEAQEQHDD